MRSARYACALLAMRAHARYACYDLCANDIRAVFFLQKLSAFPILLCYNGCRGIYCAAQNPEGYYCGGGGYFAALLHLYRAAPYSRACDCGVETGWPEWPQILGGRNSPCSLAGCQYSPSAHGGCPGAGGAAAGGAQFVVIYEVRYTRYEFGNNGSLPAAGGIKKLRMMRSSLVQNAEFTSCKTKKPRGCRGGKIKGRMANSYSGLRLMLTLLAFENDRNLASSVFNLSSYCLWHTSCTSL